MVPVASCQTRRHQWARATALTNGVWDLYGCTSAVANGIAVAPGPRKSLAFGTRGKPIECHIISVFLMFFSLHTERRGVNRALAILVNSSVSWP